MATKVVMPEMGEGVIEGTIARWLKEEGDSIEEFEPILEIETDKVTTEATAEVAGSILKIYVEEGQTVPVGTVLALIGEPGEHLPDDGEAGKPVEDAGLETADEVRETAAGTGGRQNGGRAPEREKRDEEQPFADWASPVVRRIAEEHNVDLSRVPGTGRGGRTTKKDILAYLEQREQDEVKVAEPAPQPRREPAHPAPEPQPRPARGRPVQQPAGGPVAVPGEVMPLTGMRRSIAEHMVRSKQTSPHVTTVFEVDFSQVVAHRNVHKEAYARQGARLTFTPYLVAAAAHALQQHPIVNSSWSDDGIVIRKEINIGVATALDSGLIVPVIRNANHYNLRGLAQQVNDLAERARQNSLQPAEVQGGTFTITNHGVSGSLLATPIINQPQCAILGVGIIEKRVKVIDDAIAIRPLAYITLTFDHRILDGATADHFMQAFKEAIEGWQ